MGFLEEWGAFVFFGGFITLFVVLAVASFVLGWINNQNTITEIRQHFANCEAWAAAGPTVFSYKKEYPECVKNSGRISCCHCEGDRISMIQKFTATEKVESARFGFQYVWYPETNKEYRAHVCSQCGVELWRSSAMAC